MTEILNIFTDPTVGITRIDSILGGYKHVRVPFANHKPRRQAHKIGNGDNQVQSNKLLNAISQAFFDRTLAPMKFRIHGVDIEGAFARRKPHGDEFDSPVGRRRQRHTEWHSMCADSVHDCFATELTAFIKRVHP